MNNSVDISFVIPCYNAERTLALCLDSIRKQDGQHLTYEIIVVDNNSTDNSLAILKPYQESMRDQLKITHEKKQGRSYTRHHGALMARGKYLAFIDADVYLDRHWSRVLWDNFERSSTIAAGQGQIIPCLKHGHAGLNRFRYRCVDEETQGRFILTLVQRFESPMINSAACFYRTSHYLALGGFDTQLERHEDIDLSRRAFLAGYDLVCTTEATAHVIFHGQGWLDYIKRSFDDGFYKVAYLKKWSSIPAPFPLFERPVSKQALEFFNVRNFHDVTKLFLALVNRSGRLCGQLSSYHNSLTWLPFESSGKGRVTIDGQTLS